MSKFLIDLRPPQIGCNKPFVHTSDKTRITNISFLGRVKKNVTLRYTFLLWFTPFLWLYCVFPYLPIFFKKFSPDFSKKLSPVLKTPKTSPVITRHKKIARPKKQQKIIARPKKNTKIIRPFLSPHFFLHFLPIFPKNYRPS